MPKTTTTEKPQVESETVVPEPPAKGELVHLDLHRMPSFLTGQTAWSRLPATQKALIKAKASEYLSDDELAVGVELAAAYRLDPYGNEVWFTKSKPYTDNQGRRHDGRLLIMVGRDGLRKIVSRNGLWMKCDVVHENDDVQVIHSADGNTTITHSYKISKKRGPIIGAWAMVRRGGPSGDPMGFFYADLTEYAPQTEDRYSPWAKQVSVMIMAAAERQAARQATPLGGLLVEGEDEVIDATYEEIAVAHDRESSMLPEPAKDLVERAHTIGFMGYDYGTVEVILGGADEDTMRVWVNGAHKELDEFELGRLDEEWAKQETAFRGEGQQLEKAINDAKRDSDVEAEQAAQDAGEQLRERWTEAQREYKEHRDALLKAQAARAESETANAS